MARVALVVIGFVSVPLIYVGSYLWLADNAGPLEIRAGGRCLPRQYHHGGRVAEFVFWPVHYVDRHVRPSHWGDNS
ncbi:hypothetical protein [Anatilimnocola aggregata]|uniref:hypothetical protein n=1 Tax=Anatilimnocola aggregata TaxID=2528021 RepID=UPI0011A50D3D|nr:hypothetical protein [Anatilimnocola aggregata]